MKVPPIIKKPKKAPLEKDVEAYFRRKVSEAGGLSWKTTALNYRGFPDRLVLYYGRFYLVELKRIGGKMSKLQESFAKKVIEHGGNFYLVEGHDGVNDFIKHIRNNK